MFRLFKPSADQIHTFLDSQVHQSFSYPCLGATRGEPPNGYMLDHHRAPLGHGIAVFERAVAAVRQWKMLHIPWLLLCWPEAPIAVGATVAVLVSHLGFWSLNACRIIYVIEEHGPRDTYGFAYGTLHQHAAIGEERFTVEFHPDDQTVWYDIYALSRPRPLARLVYPITRALQKRFARDSKSAMQKAVGYSETPER